MTVTTEIRPEEGRRLHKVAGTTSLEEIWGALEKVYGDPDFDPELDVLWDLRDADLSRFFSKEVSQLAARTAGKWSPAGRGRAALVVSGEMDYGLARMYEIMIGGTLEGEIRVFRNMDEAKAWLDERRYPGESSAG